MGQSRVEWVDFLSVCLSDRLPVPPLDHPAKPEAWLVGPQIWLAGPEAWLDVEQTDIEQTDGRTANPPILQDYVLYRGRCPASAHENQENLIQK